MHLGTNGLKPNGIKRLQIVSHGHHGDLTPGYGPNKIVPNTEQNTCGGLSFPEARDA